MHMDDGKLKKIIYDYCTNLEKRLRGKNPGDMRDILEGERMMIMGAGENIPGSYDSLPPDDQSRIRCKLDDIIADCLDMLNIPEPELEREFNKDIQALDQNLANELYQQTFGNQEIEKTEQNYHRLIEKFKTRYGNYMFTQPQHDIQFRSIELNYYSQLAPYDQHGIKNLGDALEIKRATSDPAQRIINYLSRIHDPCQNFSSNQKILGEDQNRSFVASPPPTLTC